MKQATTSLNRLRRGRPCTGDQVWMLYRDALYNDLVTNMPEEANGCVVCAMRQPCRNASL